MSLGRTKALSISAGSLSVEPNTLKQHNGFMKELQSSKLLKELQSSKPLKHSS
jgi:hypothetical protein